MSWIVIGDNKQSCFACNTIDRAFGYIYNCSKAELKEFGESLPDDVRSYDDMDLFAKYLEWQKVSCFYKKGE